jgi:hypothetical protein
VVSADSDVGVLVVEWNVDGDWSPELIHTSTSVGVLPHSGDNVLWDIDGGDLVVHTLWDQVVVSESGALVVGEALRSSLLSVVLEDAGSLIGGDDLQGADLIVEWGWDITVEAWCEVSEHTLVEAVLVEGELDLLSDMDGGGDVVEVGEELDDLGVGWSLGSKAVGNFSSSETVVLKEGDAVLLVPGIVSVFDNLEAGEIIPMLLHCFSTG